ncbi:MAG: PhnE/PtxC family ABC transporter permease [Burkholderiaceae bacterium]
MSAPPPRAPAVPRDPAPARRLVALAIGLAVLWPLARLAQVHPAVLFDPNNLHVMHDFLVGFVPPSTQHEFLALLARATLDTLAMATAGTALAFVIAVPLALAATRALAIGEAGPADGAWRGRWLRRGVRAAMGLLRVVPEIVWALMLVGALGLGPAAGVLAIGITYGGMLGKVYTEILESVDARPARAIVEAGGGRGAALRFGLLPLAAQELVSYTVYRWECAVRASAVMGFVGAGGLGQLMEQSLKMLTGGEVSSIAIVFLALVLLADALSAGLRRLLASRAPPGPRHAAVAGGAIVAVAAAVVGSFAWVSIDVRALVAGDGLANMARFAADFFPPDRSPELVAEVARSVLQTLAVSALGTLAAVAGGALLALPAAGRAGTLAKGLARLVLDGLRGVPELVWAALMVLAAGIGPFAGALALALHTTGVLGRLFAETLENAPPAPERALRELGARAPVAFAYGTLPVVAPQCLGYTLYRWEMNIRMAAILGFVGAGGLGQMLYYHLSLLQHAQAATVLAGMAVLVLAVDELSALARKALGATAA